MPMIPPLLERDRPVGLLNDALAAAARGDGGAEVNGLPVDAITEVSVLDPDFYRG